MQAKSTRGVQQEEVWVAADALIAAGERPTIERLRLKLGRGSPNTVSPMLDSWFANLGRRLGVAGPGVLPGENGAPAALRQALDTVWDGAVTLAMDKAHASLAEERDHLARREEKLKLAGEELGQREALLAERGVALEEALRLAKEQLNSLTAQFEKTNGELAQAHKRHTLLAQERSDDRRQFDEQLRTLSQQREGIERRAVANEHRLLEDLDRVRQEVKQSARTLERAEQKFAVQKVELERANATLQNAVNEERMELATFRERLKGATAQISSLEKSLSVATRPQDTLGQRLSARRGGMARKTLRITKRTK